MDTLAASFTYSPASPKAGQTVQFTDTSTGSPTSWEWNFGDGSTSTAKNPNHAYAASGSYSATLAVSNNSGTKTVTKTISVVATPTAWFTYSPASPKVGQAVQFTDTSTGSPTSWQWNFGDGTTSTIQNPTHVFSAVASYSVSLTVSNNSGSDNANRTITAVDVSTIIPPDRLIDWSSAGIPGGTAQYRDGGANARPLGVSVLTYGADPTGTTNCSTAFANAQNACATGHYVYIPDGTYLLSGVVSLKSNVTWRGQSVARTIIKLSGKGGFETPSQSPYVSASVGLSVTAGATKGSNVLTVSSLTDSSGHTVTAGKMVQLTQLTPSYCHAGDNHGWKAAEWVGYDETRLMSIMFMVTDVNTSAKTVTLDHALPIDMTDSPLLVLWSIQPVTGVGLEMMTFDGALGTADKEIMFVNANACWIYGCYFKTMYDRSAWFEEATNCSFEHCYSEHGLHTGSNSEGLDFFENCCWCKIEDSIFHSAGYAMVFFSDWMGGCCGNVVGYNYQDGENQLPGNGAPGTITMDDCHGPITMFNLWEGNIGEEWANDGYWGSGCYGTSFRNRWLGVPTGNMTYVDTSAIFLARWADYYTVVGNVLGTAQGSSWSTQYSQIYEASGTSNQAPQIYKLGYPDMSSRSYDTPMSNPPSNSDNLDTMVEATLIRHGNYDYVNKAVIWDPSISNQVIPSSLYLSSTPSWFGSLAWPAIGPDVSGYAQSIPAAVRWATYKSSGNVSDLF